MLKQLFLSFIILLYSYSINASLTIASATLSNAQMQSTSIVVGGVATINASGSGFVARYTSTGNLDTAFGTSGVSQLYLGGVTQINDMYVSTANNNITVTGFTNNGTMSAFIANFTASGLINTSFGASSGYTITSVGTTSIGSSIGVQSTGNFIIAGVTISDGVTEGFIARYTSTGTLDTTFGTNGITTISINPFTTITDIVIQSNDSIVAVGSTQGTTTQFVVVRLTSSGALDSTFGTGGITTTAIGTIAQATSVELQSTGAIIVGGSSDSTFALARYTTSGNLDTTFGNSGITTTTIGETSFINALLIDSSDTIYAAGNTNDCFVTAHYSSLGILDTNFGNNGNITTMQDTVTQALALVQESSTQVVAAGNITNDLTMVRYIVNNGTGSTGSLDSTFAPNGIVNAPAASIIKNVALLADIKTPGTNGGTFTSGSWQIRTLNTIKGNYQFVSLSSNQFTLQPGIYSILALAPAYNVNSHQIMLENITTGTPVSYGTSEYSVGSQTRTNLVAAVSIATAQTFALTHQCSSTQATNGFGQACGFGPEIYAVVIVTKLG